MPLFQFSCFHPYHVYAAGEITPTAAIVAPDLAAAEKELAARGWEIKQVKYQRRYNCPDCIHRYKTGNGIKQPSLRRSKGYKNKT